MSIPRIDSDFATFAAASAINQYRVLAVNTSRQVAHAAAGSVPFGVAEVDTASGAACPVKLFNAGGTFTLIAGGAVTVGALLTLTSAGKVVAAAAGAPMFVALTAAAADGDQIEALAIESVGSASIYATRAVVTSGEAAANSNNGSKTFDTGWGVQPSAVNVVLRTASTGVTKSGFAVTLGSGGSAGQITVAGVAASTQVDQNDEIEVIAIR